MKVEASQLAPVAKQALLVNSLLVLYYLLPNLSSFLLASALLLVFFAPAAIQQLACSQGECCCSLNSLFRAYLQLSGVRKLMVIVGVGVIAQITYLFPTWLVLLLVAQVLAFWELLVGLGVIELSGTAVQGTEAALTKFLNLIPRYQSE